MVTDADEPDLESFKMRKPHFISHYDRVIEFMGSLRHFDTIVTERIHQLYTTGVYEVSSKRY